MLFRSNIEKKLEKNINNTDEIELKSKKLNDLEISKFLETDSLKEENTTSIALKIPLPELEQNTIKEESIDYNTNLKKRRGRPKKNQNE